MATTTDAVIQTLNQLVETCRDGENGFRAAAEGVKTADLKVLFKSYADQRALFANELQAEVHRLGGTPEERGSLTASLHRGWMNIKSIVTGGSDEAIVAECERGEDSAVENYQRVLKQNLPPNVLPVVKHQFTEIKKSHDRIRDLEQAA